VSFFGFDVLALANMVAVSKTYGVPLRKWFSTSWSNQSASTYPVSGSISPGQDGDPRILVLIRMSATIRHFFDQGSRMPFDCQAISLPPPANCEDRLTHNHTRSINLDYAVVETSILTGFTVPQRSPSDAGQLGGQGDYGGVFVPSRAPVLKIVPASRLTQRASASVARLVASTSPSVTREDLMQYGVVRPPLVQAGRQSAK
jgi:hypothetical protein